MRRKTVVKDLAGNKTAGKTYRVKQLQGKDQAGKNLWGQDWRGKYQAPL